jgi:hypothetical protein
MRVPRREFAISRNLELGSLTVVYDNEQITWEGSVDLTNTGGCECDDEGLRVGGA